MLFITIPTPCHEDWNKMETREKGAFCNLCSKAVIDFTALSDEEVKNYLLTHQGQKTCGRFYTRQLANSETVLSAITASNIPAWKKFVAIALVLFSSFFNSCKERVVGKIAVPGDTTIVRTGVPGQIEEAVPARKEPVEEKLILIKGFTSVLIIPENDTANCEKAGDTILPAIEVRTELLKKDTSQKIFPAKIDCDSFARPTIYL